MANTKTKTLGPELGNVEFANSIDFYKKYTNYLTYFTTIQRQLMTVIDWLNAKQRCDTVTAQADFFANLNKESFKYLDNEYIEYWINQYNNALSEVKVLCGTKLSGITPLYYIQYSDSIGILANSQYILDDSTISVYGVGKPRIGYPASLNNKLSSSVKGVLFELQQSTSSLYQKNMIRMATPMGNSMFPHGSNLVTDNAYYDRVKLGLSVIVKKLSDDYKEVFKVVNFYANISNNSAYNARSSNNMQSVSPVYIEKELEGTKQIIDLLQNRIKIGVRKNKDIKMDVILGAKSKTNTSKSNFTTIQIDSIYKNIPTAGNIPTIPDPVAKTLEQQKNITSIAALPVDITKLDVNNLLSNPSISSLTASVPLADIAAIGNQVSGLASDVAGIGGDISGLASGNISPEQLLKLKDTLCNFQMPIVKPINLDTIKKAFNIGTLPPFPPHAVPLRPPSFSAIWKSIEKQLIKKLEEMEQAALDFYKKMTECKNLGGKP